MHHKVDYLIVGLGIAGIAVCEALEERNQSFVVFNNQEACATAASGGVINPTILKWFNTPWKTEFFFPESIKFYQNLSKKIDPLLFTFNSIVKIFNSVSEQNNWFVASDKQKMKAYLKPIVLQNLNKNINAPFGFGEVIGCLQIDIDKMLDGYIQYLQHNQLYIQENFRYDLVKVKNDYIEYNHWKAKKIIFCEGLSVVRNPFFPANLIIPNKGEYIIIHAPSLKLNQIMKGSYYIIPLGKDYYKVGATFEGESEDWKPSKETKDFLVSELRRIINCPFTVHSQVAGIRPTTIDHKPILGFYDKNENFAFLNGLGTRGLMMAPALGKILIDFLEDKKPIPSEMDVNRFG